jgi:alpha-beta hydrolase superfamily lysophospholipase
MKGRRWLRWLVGIGLALVVLVTVAVAAFLLLTRNPAVDAFYDPPDDLSGAPGTILRSEPFDDGLPTGSRGWKMLYISSDPDGRPIAVSGLVIAPANPASGPHPVLAWSHGTIGIARPCAPSISGSPLAGIPDMAGALAQGWVLTLTDYPGLGTPSPHPYLVGESEGRAVLDSVRAAHQLDTGIELDDRYAVWGHSQGGHAALFAGQLAPTYMPEYTLVGVAALAPATTLHDNLAAIEGTTVGDVLIIFAVESWTDFYPDIPDGTLTEQARRPAQRIARACLNQPSRFRIVVNGLVLPDTIVAIDPTTDPAWRARLDDNTPDPTRITAPVFLAQGLDDEIIAPAVTKAWARTRCDGGAPTVWKTYADVTHLAIVGPGGSDALDWTIDRFDHAPLPTNTCPTS